MPPIRGIQGPKSRSIGAIDPLVPVERLPTLLCLDLDTPYTPRSDGYTASELGYDNDV